MKVPEPIVRDMRFGLSADLPKYWYDGDPAVTALFNALSMLFPEGERFFVRSVKHYAAKIDNPEVLGPVKAFMGQEGAHSREHAALNALIASQWGKQAKGFERRAAEGLRWMEKRIPRSRRLAITCALEHLTAIFAEAVLSDPRILEKAHPRYAEMWKWHAREELEHKAVAFDVYEEAVGSYVERTSVLISETFFFFFFAHLIAFRLLQLDKQPLASSALQIAKFMLLKPGVAPKIVGPWLAYFKPGFHPWDNDNRHLLEAFGSR